MNNTNGRQAFFHLPGLFEFYELYKVFLPLFYNHREYFYDWCQIGSVYGAPSDCLWGGGRVGFGDDNPDDVLALMKEYNISARLTFSNSLLTQEHLGDKKCNRLCSAFAQGGDQTNGVIVHSDLLLDYLKEKYPELYLVSSTTKVLVSPEDLITELGRRDFRYVVPDFRLNKKSDLWQTLSEDKKEKVEFLCNECCWPGCPDRKKCYEDVSRKSLGVDGPCHVCSSPDREGGYSFSKAMANPEFISREDITGLFIPMGYNNFKIEGRSLGSALVLEFLLYYMTKPEYQIHVREHIYLDNTLDLF